MVVKCFKTKLVDTVLPEPLNSKKRRKGKLTCDEHIPFALHNNDLRSITSLNLFDCAISEIIDMGSFKRALRIVYLPSVSFDHKVKSDLHISRSFMGLIAIFTYPRICQ